MSEYCLRYTCRAKSEKNKSKEPNANENKALKFLLFQDFQNDGELCIQIPISVPDGYAGIRLYHIENGVDIPRTFDAESFSLHPFIPKSQVEQNGCIFIRGKRTVGGVPLLSGTGMIGFCKNQATIPALEDCYSYSLSLNKKQPILYTIAEKKNKIAIEILHPLLRENIVLNIFSAQNGKPLLKDNLPERKIGSITLEAGNKNFLRRTIKTETIGVDYRLFFDEPRDSKFYLLVDESEETYEEGGQNKKKRRIKRYYDDYKKTEKKKCPYCFHELKLPSGYKNAHTICECTATQDSQLFKVKKNEKLLTATEHGGMVSCGRENRGSATNLGLYKNLILPKDYLDSPDMNVVVIGARNSGKSVMLSSLLGVKSRSNDSAEAYFSSALLNCIVKRFAKSGVAEPLVLSRVKFENEANAKFLNLSNENIDKVEIDSVVGTNEGKEYAYRKYLVTPGEPLPPATILADIARTGLHPFGFKLGNLGHVHFYDVPGEAVRTDRYDKDALRALINAECIIAVMDCANERLSDSISDIENALKVAYSLIREDVYDMPVAIVLTKFDYIRDKLDDNCHVLRENMLDIIGKSGSKKYRGSEIQRHVNCSSYEIEHYLAAEGHEGFLESMKQYKYHKFFALSALGSKECLSHDASSKNNRERPDLNYRERPIRLELPILWLMYQKGFIN